MADDASFDDSQSVQESMSYKPKSKSIGNNELTRINKSRVIEAENFIKRLHREKAERERNIQMRIESKDIIFLAKLQKNIN